MGFTKVIIRELFNAAFEELKGKYPHFMQRSAAEVQAAYFASKKQRGGERQAVESREGSGNKEDREAWNLIMRDKERLLSFDSPVAFIFSHSALREGWDNPNVCQICTLRQVGTETERRQQVGRGMRLVVNQKGERLADPAANMLTVVAGESYKRFVADLQRELIEEYGEAGAPPRPVNARQKKPVTRKPLDQLPPEFAELWERIRQKTRYHVEIDTDQLAGEVVADLDKLSIDPPRIVADKAEIAAEADRDQLVARRLTATHALATLVAGGNPRDIVGMVEDLLSHARPPIRLTRRTLSPDGRGHEEPRRGDRQPARVCDSSRAGHTGAGRQATGRGHPLREARRLVRNGLLGRRPRNE